jgi:hypothetical protein
VCGNPFPQFLLRNDDALADPQRGKIILLNEFVNAGLRDSHEIHQLLHIQQQGQFVIAGINAFLQIVSSL